MFEIGSSLREARTRQALTVEEMETRTKVRAKYLRLLEDERFGELPAHPYVKGFLRAYANELGLDGQLYVDEYNSRFVGGEDEAPTGPRRVPAGRARRRDAREHRVVALAIGSIAVVTALIIAAWRFGGPEPQEIEGLSGSGVGALPTAKSVTLEVRATKGASFMEVHLGSALGRQLYAGTLERGDVQRFLRLKRIYVSLASPGNVLVKLNGNRIRLPEGGEALITRRGVRVP